MVLATVAAMALFATSCKQSQSSAGPSGDNGTIASGPSTVIPADEGTPKNGGKLAFGIDAEPDGLDPLSNNFAYQGHLISSSMYETLVVFDADRNIKPYLAESIEPSDLALRWKITVKPNITFHDGTPLNGEAVRANIEAQRKGIGGIALKSIESVSVVGDLAVEVKMNQPWASFPAILATEEGYMVAPAALGNADLATHPVGTGPFVFDSWTHGSKLSVKKNPTYWQPGKPHLDAIEFRIISDPNSRASALASGDLDMITTEQTTTMADYRSKQGFRTLLDQSGDAESIYLNQGGEPFDNADARKAVIQATDNAAIAENLGSGILKPIDQPFADKSPYHQADPHYPKFDVEAAKKSVAQYTSATGKPLEFTLLVFAGSTNLALAQLLQAQWKNAGIKAEIKSMDQAEAIKDIIFGKTQAGLAANFGYPDPDFFFYFWHSSFTAPVGQLSVNFPHLKNDALDDALTQGRVNLLPEKRKEAYLQAVRLLNEGSTYIWLYRFVAALIAEDAVRGLKPIEQTGFATLAAKNWYGELWLDRK